MTSMEEIVEKEIDDFKHQRGDFSKYKPEGWYHYFNNFFWLLPDLRDECIYNDLFDKIAPKEEKSRRSDKRAMISTKDFLADIDLTISEIGLDLEKLKKLQERLRLMGNFEDYENLANFIKPLYIKLREKGYTRPDLV